MHFYDHNEHGDDDGEQTENQTGELPVQLLIPKTSGADDDLCQHTAAHHGDNNAGKKNDQMFYELHDPCHFAG